ncbi:hypothetical protein DL766_008256 [Monosporascus sp. MC13-8B]|uniref:Protein kinase domain-containing protein n=1 Tax=Monosporascus cannonballus TaxID=155416 RepID=A0ABY0HFK2_9PEZI|nr:hypothetical protein DL763_010885 [Monosporascus cannonballus]RYO89368.1 hypothetical protein DL762_003259 [Monosporascus cannonballus]RYP20159.1 hypothetical protein DL766_008256 [Monosporascus sp. MC13-8B]
MTTARRRSYRHYGVYLPVEARPVEGHTGNVGVPNGSLLVKYIRYDLFVVQSAASGRLYLNKIRKPDTYNYDLPEELCISTASGAEVELPWDSTRFNTLSLWQALDKGYYSLYFELAEAIRFFNFGAEPGADNGKVPWNVTYHRELAPNNICIHYPSRSGAGRPPRTGFFENAFPDIVVIDIGLSALESDDDALLRPAIFRDKNEADEWEDIYMMGKILRQLCQTHIPIPIDDNDFDDWGDRPECVRMATVNNYLNAADTRYSNQLIATLKEFEWPNCETQRDVMGTQVGPSGRVVPNHEYTPDARWVADVLLPLARQKVREYRNPRAGYPPDYYRRLDVSWTKPANLMPFVYDFDSAPLEDISSEDERSEGDDEGRIDDEGPEEEEEPEDEREGDREDGGGKVAETRRMATERTNAKTRTCLMVLLRPRKTHTYALNLTHRPGCPPPPPILHLLDDDDPDGESDSDSESNPDGFEESSDEESEEISSEWEP